MIRCKTKPPAIPERFVWAANLLQPRSTGNILEIGCGVGLLAAQVAGTLTSGRYYAVDPSYTRLAQAKKRNQTFIDQGKINIQGTKFLEADLPLSFFQCIVAFNVNVFFQDAAEELKKIATLLSPGGAFFIFYQAPFEIDLTAAAPAIKNLEKNAYEIIDTHLKEFQPTSAICIIARPIPQSPIPVTTDDKKAAQNTKGEKDFIP